MTASDWDKNEIIAQGWMAYETHGRSLDANPYRFTPLSRQGPSKAGFWEKGWLLAASANPLRQRVRDEL
jgi:hypothetical protein